MYFFILINSRKVKSTNKTKQNYIKISLNDIGTNNIKKYSSIIVNDIKIDFSINLIEKSLYNKINKFINKDLISNNTSKTEKKSYFKLHKSYDKNKSFKKPILFFNFNNTKRNSKIIKKNNKIYKISSTTLLNKEKENENRQKEKQKLLMNNINYIDNILGNDRIKSAVNKKNKERSYTVLNKPENNIIKPKKLSIDNISGYSFLKNNNNNNNNNNRNKVRSQTVINKSNNLNYKLNNLKYKERIEELKKEYDSKVALIKIESKKKKEKILEGSKKEKNIKNEVILEKENVIEKKEVKKENEYFLEPIIYDSYLKNNKKNKNRETFCEGFFISSFPKKDGQVIEKSQSFPAICGHKECSSLPSMKPEIIMRYPLEDTKTLELNNLAATICFPTGIKVCYNEDNQDIIKDYVTPITNQKGDRYYMINYHFYLKMENDIYSKNYEMHPLKHHLMKFADNYLNMSEDEMNDNITKKIQNDLEQAQDLGFRDYVFIPYCISLISKYPYVYQIKKCLQSIYYLIINKKNENENLLNELIMHLINSVPVPNVINTKVQFYIPYLNNELEIKCPKLKDLSIMNTNISDLLKLFSIDYIIIIFKFLIFEKKILFIDDDYTRLSNVTDSFISLLYPFQWIHTYIPIMSDQMIQYLQTFLPFLNGINNSLMPLVIEIFKEGEMEENDEIFLIYINQSKFRLGSTLIGKNKKKYKYIEETIPSIPTNLEKELKNKLKKIKEEIENYQKKTKDNIDLNKFDLKIRNAFIEMFVQMFHDIYKYICFIDEDVVFNKNLFLENIQKEDKKFYDDFIETQLFQLFCQNIIKDELNYFKKRIKEFNLNNKFINEDKEKEEKKNIKEKIYIIQPDYLNIKEKNKKIIKDIINKNYNLNEKEKKDKNGLNNNNNNRITEYIKKIENNNYDNKKCKIYLIPDIIEKKNSIDIIDKNNFLTNEKNIDLLKEQYKTIKNKNIDLTEKEKDLIKEKIKDFTIKIFKTEDIEFDDINLKKDLQNDLNTKFGREFFVSLLSKNTSNIILLKDNSFNLFGTLIYNILLYILQVEENDIILEQIIILIKSTKYFGKQEKGNIITLWDIYKQKINGYPKVNQINLWNKWYQINLNIENENENQDIKKKIILDICDLMTELELNKIFIKNTLEILINNAFGKDNEKSKNILQEVVQKIIDIKYKFKPNSL